MRFDPILRVWPSDMLFFNRSFPAEQVIASAAKALPDALQEHVISLVLYGAHADKETREKTESIQLLIVLKEINPTILERLAAAYKQIKGYRQLSPMVMTPEELRSSTDVFPVTFLEMQRCHRLLAGDDCLEELSIRFDHLRLRCEQRLKNLLLRMQNTYLTTHDDTHRMASVLQRNFSSYERVMGTALLLKDTPRPEGANEVLLTSAAAFGLDVDTTRQVIDAMERRASFSDDALRSLYVAFLSLVHEAANVIDALPDAEVELLGVEEQE